ncbi:DUF3883 domain-containing protein [Pseudooceanicola nitratireducens]|uniref:DUF3883 domain-containing protein n=1 Tax=Pseudooceanicola nitratireducens TaxID=517719 RepID=UPI003C7A8144
MVDWTDEENDLIVADYFAMFRMVLAGTTPNKSQHRRALLSKIQTINDRNEKSIERKHMNISGVLMGAGEIWLPGYAPNANYQKSLEDAVARWLSANGGIWPRAGFAEPQAAYSAGKIELVIPPHMRNEPPPRGLRKLSGTAQRFDAAGRDERNRTLGRLGEERALAHEIASLKDAGRNDLARKVVWVSKEIGDGLGYDISSFTPDGTPRLLEVKTTNGWDRTPFHISQNELRVAGENRDTWHLFRIYNNARGPRAFELRPPLNNHVTLTPTSFQARFD